MAFDPSAGELGPSWDFCSGHLPCLTSHTRLLLPRVPGQSGQPWLGQRDLLHPGGVSDQVLGRRRATAPSPRHPDASKVTPRAQGFRRPSWARRAPSWWTAAKPVGSLALPGGREAVGGRLLCHMLIILFCAEYFSMICLLDVSQNDSRYIGKVLLSPLH